MNDQKVSYFACIHPLLIIMTVMVVLMSVAIAFRLHDWLPLNCRLVFSDYIAAFL